MLGKSGNGLGSTSSFQTAVTSPLGLVGLNSLMAVGLYLAGSVLSAGGFSTQSLCTLLLLLSSLILGAVHQPWRPSGRAHLNTDVRSIVRTLFTGLLFALQLSLFLFGLVHLGAIRTLIVSESAMHLYRTLYAGLFRSQALAGARLRGLLCILVAYALLFWIDRLPLSSLVAASSLLAGSDGTAAALDSSLKNGVLLLICSTLVAVLKNNMLRTLSTDQADESRLYATITPVATVFSLAPLLFSSFFSMVVDVPASDAAQLGDSSSSFVASSLGLLFCSFALLTVPQMISSFLSSGRIAQHTAHLACTIGSFVTLAILDFSYDVMTISALLFVEIGLTFAGIHWLIVADGGDSRLDLAKKSENFLPSYAESSHGPSLSAVASIKNIIAQILANPDSRSIFTFLTINLLFMFVEMAYGYWTNSLGLISDAFHMLTDCSALAIGLYASMIAKWDPTPEFSYGYARVQTLAGFANAVFLVFISFSVLTEGLARLIDPPQVKPEELFVVSCIGLGVNLIGMFAFSGHGHVHGGHGGHDDEAGHHGHSHGDANMSGVFLHVLADTLGSVGVIISSILIWAFDWQRSDPLCSLILSVLIFVSVVPLLKSSITTLLHKTPGFILKQLPRIRSEIEAVSGVLKIDSHHFWRYEGDHFVGSLSIEIAAGADPLGIRNQVTHILSQIVDVRNCTVQLRTSKALR